MEESADSMYKSADRTAALRIVSDGVCHDLRHLFSGVEIYRPTARKKFQRREHVHDVYHVVLYLRGEGTFNCCGREIGYQPGVLALTGPGQPHLFGPYEPDEEETEYWSFTFDLVDAEGRPLTVSFVELLSRWWGVGESELDLTPRVLSRAELQRVRDALDHAVALKMMREMFPRPQEAATVLNLLAVLLGVFHCGNPERPGKVPPRLYQAAAMLDNDLRSRLSVADLAHAAAMSRAHFLRCFKQVFGETPMRRSRRRRLEHAVKMLEQEDCSLKEVAAATGFCDEFHFSKAFKAEFGECPSAFVHRLRRFRL